jgi:hypothetical protein
MTYSARTTGTSGLWSLRRDAKEIGSIAILPGTVEHPQLVVDAMVHGLNHPPPLEGFGGKGGEMLAGRRHARATMLDNTARGER